MKKSICCKYCGTFDNLRKGMRLGKEVIYPVCINHYQKYKEAKQLKREKTNIEKYGVVNVMQTEDVKNKQKITVFNKYGVDNPSKSEEIKNKREKTNISRYGGKTPASSKVVRDKMKTTSIERYGVDNPIKNKEIKAKAIKSNLEKYGVENIFSSESFKENIRIINKEKYGVEYFTQTDEMKNKSKKTMVKNHGVEYYSQNKDIKEKMWKTYRKNYWDTFVLVLKQRYIEPMFDKIEYIEVANIDKLQYKCLRCNKILTFSFLNPHRICCTCSQHRSYYEDDIISWLKSVNVVNIKPNEKYYENGKLKYEIDIYLPDYDLGIDFNGIYWHCDLYRNRTYHQNKYKYFKEKGIHLIQIFENEWVNKQDIVKSIIRNKLKLNDKIFARKCEIKEVDSKVAARFLQENHLQSVVGSKIRIGLYYKNELICLGTFGKYRFKDQNAFELIRFSSKLNTSVIGGFERILKYFESMHPDETLISFVDVRFFSGNSYKGFENIGLTDPNYFYFREKDKTFTLMSRVQFQKHKLKNRLKVFDPNISERDNMINNGYLRIFDAGNLKFIKNS